MPGLRWDIIIITGYLAEANASPFVLVTVLTAHLMFAISMVCWVLAMLATARRILAARRHRRSTLISIMRMAVLKKETRTAKPYVIRVGTFLDIQMSAFPFSVLASLATSELPHPAMFTWLLCQGISTLVLAVQELTFGSRSLAGSKSDANLSGVALSVSEPRECSRPGMA